MRNLFVVLMLLFCNSVFSQKLTIESFEEVPSDLSARTQPREDINGTPCALVKVQLASDGAKFEGNVIGDVSYRTSEYNVYLSNGSKRLTILLDGYLPLTVQFSDYGINRLESMVTYLLTVTIPLREATKPQVVTSQNVLFRLSPSNAVVDFNGQTLETVDGTATVRMSFGTYDYRVLAPRYAPMVGKVTVDNPKEKHIVSVSLAPQFANYSFSVDRNAEIWINEKKYGVGNCTVELSYGTYSVECRLEGHRTSIQEIVLNAESKHSFRLNAPQPIYGSLDINSSPADADIFVDGRKVGTTPMLLHDCLIGSHTIKISKTGYKEYTSKINVTKGETSTITAHMEKGSSLSMDVKTFNVKGVKFTMVPVEGGSFMMGATEEQKKPDRDETPIHRVSLSSFMIGKTEVTQALWKAVMGNNPSFFKGENRPVENISWNDCQLFIEKLNVATGQKFRLPTEAEWEYAARGGNKSRRYQYSGGNNVDEVAWCSDNSYSKTHNVGTKKANELGICDMSGNVWEWCGDCYGIYSSSDYSNPNGLSSRSNRVNRGGSWNNGAWYCRSAVRFNNSPVNKFSNVGLRLALSE